MYMYNPYNVVHSYIHRLTRESIRRRVFTDAHTHGQTHVLSLSLAGVLKHLFMSRVLACIPHRLFYFRRPPCAPSPLPAIECQGRNGGNYPVELSGHGGIVLRFLIDGRIAPVTALPFQVSRHDPIRGWNRDLKTRYSNDTRLTQTLALRSTTCFDRSSTCLSGFAQSSHSCAGNWDKEWSV